MESFRKDILKQIEQIERGRIFTFRDLSFEDEKAHNVAQVLSEQCRKGNLKRLEKGAYYRPKESLIGLGPVPVYQDEMLRYINKKLHGGYLTGSYIYNQMGLTEQVSRVMTIATRKPVRRFRFRNLYIKCVKSYCENIPSESLIPYLRVLDAIKDMKHVPGATPQKVYDRLKHYHFDEYSQDELKKIVSLAKQYPPRVRKTVADLLGDLGQSALQEELARTIHRKTRFKLRYERHKA